MRTILDKVTYLCTCNNLALQRLKSTYLCNKHNWLLNWVKMGSSLHKCHNGSRNILNEKWSLRSTVSSWKWSSWKNCKILDPIHYHSWVLTHIFWGRCFPFFCVFLSKHIHWFLTLTEIIFILFWSVVNRHGQLGSGTTVQMNCQKSMKTISDKVTYQL